MPQLKTGDWKPKALGVAALMLLPVVVFAGYWHLYAVNVPWFDDFEALPDFLLRFFDAPTLSEKWHWLLWPNNEHRMATGKALAVALHALTGHLNFRTLEAIANLSTLGLLGLFFAAFRRLGLPLAFFLPVPYLLFQPQYHLLSFWAITGVQHQPVLLFAFLALFLVAEGSPTTLALGLLSGLVATFTMSNGMLVWPAGAVVLGLQGRWRGLAVWLGAAAAGIGGYFYGFPSRANETSFARFLATPYLSLMGFFTFWGAAFDFFPNAPIGLRSALPTAAGLGLAGWMGWWGWTRGISLSATGRHFLPGTKNANGKLLRSGGLHTGGRRHSHRYFLLGALLFLLANAAIVAVLRPHFGYFVLLVSNYKLYPTLALILAYLMILEAKPTFAARRFGWMLAGSVAFWAASYLAYTPDVSLRRRYLLTSVYNQVNSGIGLGATRGDVGEPYIEAVFRQLLARKFYHWPDEFSASLRHPNPAPAALSVRIRKDDTFFYVENDAFTPPDGRENAAYLWVRRGSDRYLYPAVPPPYRGRNPFRGGVGFVAKFHRHHLHPGTYSLTLCVVENGKLTSYPVRQTLTAP